jgi:hypothetical protein
MNKDVEQKRHRPRRAKNRSRESTPGSDVPRTKGTIRRRQKPIPKEDTRLEELDNIVHLIQSVPQIKLINSSNKARIFKIEIDKESYKLTVPILKKLPIQLQSMPQKQVNMDVIKNFNTKVRSMDHGLKFYLNYLINDYHHLASSQNEYRLYEMAKKVTNA